jgi:REP element-mobilizing transposase RayT
MGINDKRGIIMANTYHQLSIQLVFGVRFREALIEDCFREKLHGYITGIIKKHDQKLLAINSVSDHIHMLIGISPNIRLSDLVREIKSSSARFINEGKMSRNKFYWQNGFGAFSYSMSHRKRVIQYIENQQIHHAKTTFREEYLNFLEKFDVDYHNKYLFDFFE